MLTELASDRVIDHAYDWLCRQRRDWPDRADVWDLRFHWDREKPRLKEALRTGRYRFSPLERVTNRNGENVSVWSARDALVIKALALVLGQTLPVSTHLYPRQGPRWPEGCSACRARCTAAGTGLCFEPT